MPYGGDPAGSDADAVRFWIGDTDPANPLFSDAEIDYLLELGGSPLNAAILACNSLIARYAHEVSRTIGSLSVNASDRMKHFMELRKTLVDRATLRVTPIAGGISVGAKAAQEANTDRVLPFFTRDGSI